MKRDISNKILQDRMETGPSKLAAYKKNSDKSKSNNLQNQTKKKRGTTASPHPLRKIFQELKPQLGKESSMPSNV